MKKILWVEEDTHHQFNLFKAKHKFKSFDAAVVYLLRQNRALKRGHPDLEEKLRFTLT